MSFGEDVNWVQQTVYVFFKFTFQSVKSAFINILVNLVVLIFHVNMKKKWWVLKNKVRLLVGLVEVRAIGVVRAKEEEIEVGLIRGEVVGLRK